MLFIVFIIPETPRWLVAHGRSSEALAVLRRLNKKKHTDEEIVASHQAIVDAVEVEQAIGAGSWKDLLHNDGETERGNSESHETDFIRHSKSTASTHSLQYSGFPAAGRHQRSSLYVTFYP